MKIRSKKTKLEHIISTEDWEKMKAQGRSGIYDVISNSDSEGTNKPPADLTNSEYDKVLESAKAALKKKDYPLAKRLFTQAKDMKTTPYIVSQLDKIEGAMNNEKS